jgi:cation transport ATPase
VKLTTMNLRVARSAMIEVNLETHAIDLSLGVVGHEGSTVLVVLNGLRLLRLRPGRST